MKRVILPNGLTVIYEQKKGASVVVEVMVKVGSNQENKKERGLAHFLEHMLFEGTSKRPTNLEISNEIEKIGGDFNAYTNNERTCFYVKVLKKHFSKAIEILSDIIQNPIFKEEFIAKEKQIVLKEIDMVNDEPKFYQWILLQKNLFRDHPTRFPTYGEKKIVRSLNRKKVLEFFEHYYAPNNLIVSVVGDVPNWRQEIKNKFVKEKGKKVKQVHLSYALETKNRIKKEKRKIVNTYTLIGFKTVPRNNPDSYVLEVINGVLGRGQSGKMFTEIRSKRGLAYDVGTQNVNEVSYGYFAAYATINRKNVNLVRKLILQEIKKLEKISERDLKEAKTYLEGDYLLELENSQKIADQILFWEQVKDARLMKDYLKRIKKVSKADVRRVIRKYFNKHTLVVLEGK